MNFRQFVILDTLAREGQPMSSFDLTYISDINQRYLYNEAKVLTSAGFLCKPHQGLYILTERGKIAHAIQVGRNARAAHKRKHKAA
jgi:hypothetical protein